MCSKSLFLLVALYFLSAACFAQLPSDLGIVTFVSGEVRLRSSAGDESVPKPFGRIRANDRFTLRPGATLRILYLQSGNSELWNGPMEFNIGNGPQNPGSAPAQVQRLSVAARTKMQTALRINSNERLGGVTVRSIGTSRDAKASLDADQLTEIREIYGQLRKEFPGNDITPEVFLSMSIQQYLSANQ